MNATQIAKSLQGLSITELRAKHEEVLGEPTTSKKKPQLITKIVKTLLEREEMDRKRGRDGEKTKASAPVEAAQPASAAVSPRERDPRLPPPGTVLEKRDRQGAVRCKCTVEADGIRYNRTLFRSLSAAGAAAAKDLGIKCSQVNGYLFWNLIKQEPRATDAAELIEKAGARYLGRVEGVAGRAKTLDDETKTKVRRLIAKQSEKLAALASAI